MLEIGLAILNNQWTRLMAAALIAYLVGFYSVEQPDIAAIEANAAKGRDAEWTRLLAAKEREFDARVEASVAAGAAEPATSPDHAERVRQCAASPSCRERGGS